MKRKEIESSLYWACACYCLDTISSPGQDRTQYLDAILLWSVGSVLTFRLSTKLMRAGKKNGLTTENRIDQPICWGCGYLKDLTRFLHSLSFLSRRLRKALLAGWGLGYNPGRRSWIARLATTLDCLIPRPRERGWFALDRRPNN